ncbi:hypothetical protein [Acrocarpospora sp. B8E8]|uniref:hypothetical protein n=1 Tax=Acrocarpospora sp. B8E8 TaxID=3153572 RepID=UPI00325FD086
MGRKHDGVVKPFDQNPGAYKEVSWNVFKEFPRGFRDRERWCYAKPLEASTAPITAETNVATFTEDQKKKYKYYVWAFEDAGALGNNVGGQGLAYNQKVGKPVFVFGYPSGSHPDGNYAYTGITQKWSYGKTFKAQALAIKAEELIGVKSSFTGAGSAGSAWLMTYKNSRRLGYLNGVTSKVSDTDGNNRIDVSVSPYFDGELYGVYKAVANKWSGSIAVPYEVPSGWKRPIFWD